MLGDMMLPMYITTVDLSGKKFGRWKVLSFSYRKTGTTGLNYQYWNCVCDCGNTRVVEGASLKRGNSVSCGCLKKEMAPKGSNHYMWKGDDVSYHGIHAWLRKHFGKADKCDNLSCAGKSNRFEWAKLKGTAHARKRENYQMLCHSCHFNYDMTAEWGRKSQEGLKRYRNSL